MARRDGDECGDIQRRRFLGLAMGGAASLYLTGCGDDGNADGGSDGGSDSGDGTTGDTPPGTTAGDVGDTSVDDTGDSSGSDGTTTGEPPLQCDEDGAFEERWDPPGMTQDDAVFPLAVMAGEMKPTSAMFTTYVEDAQPKYLRVWRGGPAEGTVVVVAEIEVTPSRDGYAKASVEGLCPGVWYFYAWLVGEPGNYTARSAIGQVRTAIADDALEPLTLAISACNGNDLVWPAMEAMADEPYDMFLHLGDMAYNDGSQTLAEYRDSWKEYLGAYGMRLPYSRAGLYATWDDHEIDDNSNFDRETMDPAELQRRQNAMDAYFELMPIDATGPDYQLWRSFRWGLTAEIFVLDCRYERRPSMGQYISPAQMNWLKQALSDSPCHFKIVMNSVPITNMPGVWDLAADDRWEGYPESRNELLNHIDSELLENVWFISGDFHVCFVSTLEPAPATLADGLREIAVTGGNTNPLGDFLAAPQFEYGTSSPRGLILTLDPAGNYINVRFIDPATGLDDYNADLSY